MKNNSLFENKLEFQNKEKFLEFLDYSINKDETIFFNLDFLNTIDNFLDYLILNSEENNDNFYLINQILDNFLPKSVFFIEE